MTRDPKLDLKRIEAAIRGTGLHLNDEKQFPFICISIEGEDGSGKTDWTWRAPKPLAYFHTDFGYDRIRSSVRALPGVAIMDIPYETPHIDKKKQWQKYAEEGLVLHKGIWQPFRETWYKVAEAPRETFRTLALDTGGEFWSFLRICNFGKLHQNPQLSYGPVKAEFMDLVRTVKRNRKNLIIIHQLKDEYKDRVTDDGMKSVKTGARIMDGFDKMNYLIDAFLVARRVDPTVKVDRKTKQKIVTGERRFEIEIRHAKHDLSLNGLTLEDPDFVTVASLLKPEVDVSEWE